MASKSNLKLTIKKILIESLGVPEGIVETSEKLYEDLMRSLHNTSVDENDDEFEFDLDNVNYKVGDLDIDSVKVIFEVNKRDINDYVITSYATPFKSRANTDNDKLEVVTNFNEFIVKIVFVVPKDWSFDKLVDLLKREKSEIIPTFSHELMHAYDFYKRKYDMASGRAKYQAPQNLYLNIKPIDNFLHLLYFTHAIENTVRSSELAAAVKINKVTRDNFLDFLKKDTTYKNLNDAKNFSYEKLKSELKNYIPEIDELGNHINKYMGDTDEEKIDEVLRLVRVNLINNTGDSYIDLMTVNQIEQMFGFQGKKNEIFKKFLKKLVKFDNNEDFFKNEEKLFNFTGDKMIRKISKIYDMAASENKSIKEWDLHHKINNSIKNITTEIKFGANY